MPPTAAPSLAQSALRLGTEGAFAVLARARELERAGRDVVHLEIGEPDFPTPAHVAEAAFAAIRAGETGYGPAAGLPELREAAAAELSRTRGVPIAPERVLVANGAKPFLFFGVLATCEPGDEVLYPDPGLPDLRVGDPLRRRDARAAHPARAQRLRVLARRACGPADRAHEARDPQLAAEPDRRRPRARDARRGGGHPARQRRVGALGRGLRPPALRGRLRVDRDRARHARADDRARQLLEDVRDDRLALRLRHRAGGARRAADALRRQLDVVRAAVRAARRDRSADRPRDAVAAMRAEFRARRDFVVDGLAVLPGVRCRVPHGAFYAFPNVEAVPLGADALARRLLDEAGVALLSGTAFGAAGENHLRLSYATSRDRLAEGIARMGAFLAAL